MITNITFLAEEARKIHDIFQGFFYLFITVLLLLGVTMEYFRWPVGGMPNFGTLIGRALVAAILLNSFPEITNAIADVTDSLAQRLGDLNNFHLVLDRMGDKLHELSWSWVSVKDTVMLIISFLTFFLLYFSVHLADAFYIYVWTMLFVFSPLLIALYVLPQTAGATAGLFRALIEVACWKIVWSVIATLLWSSALSQINQQGSQVSFLSAIAFNIILAGSLLLTPFIVSSLAGNGLAQMAQDVGSLALGGWRVNPKAVAQKSRHVVGRGYGHAKSLVKQYRKDSRASKSDLPKSMIKSNPNGGKS